VSGSRLAAVIARRATGAAWVGLWRLTEGGSAWQAVVHAGRSVPKRLPGTAFPAGLRWGAVVAASADALTGSASDILVVGLTEAQAVPAVAVFGFAAAAGRGERSLCALFARQLAASLRQDERLRDLEAAARRLRRVQARLVHSEERLRRRLAEQLHGPVQSRLVVVWHQLGRAEELAADRPELRDAIAEARRALDRVREQEIRQVGHVLHPAILDLGLLPAVRSLLDSLSPSVQVTFSATEAAEAADPPVGGMLSGPARLAMYRALEEAVSNALRHGGAKRLDVALARQGDRLILTVRDDGRGLQGAREGVGLVSVKARLAEHGGSVSLSSSPGGGACFEASLPLVGSSAQATPPRPIRRPVGRN
jgi:signal transduction histidine kinase